MSVAMCAMMNAMLPRGGSTLALVEAYFDESYGMAKGRRVLCVAGYLLTDRAARRMSRSWSAILAEYGLPYFHMVDCAHGSPPFDNLTMYQRIEVEKKMIDQIKRRTIIGMAATVDVDEFELLMPKHPYIGSPYTFCAHTIIGGVANWITKNNCTDDVAYFFESGHDSQTEANGIMNRVFHDPKLASVTNYAGHAFVDKSKAPPVQAADILAWQWYTDVRHRIEGKPRRKDLASLLKHKHLNVHISAKKIMELATKWTGVRYRIDLGLSSILLGDDADA